MISCLPSSYKAGQISGEPLNLWSIENVNKSNNRNLTINFLYVLERVVTVTPFPSLLHVYSTTYEIYDTQLDNKFLSIILSR